MNVNFKLAIAFFGGVAAGCAGMFYGVKKRYELLAEKEIESVKEHFDMLHSKGRRDIPYSAAKKPGPTTIPTTASNPLRTTDPRPPIDYTKFKKPSPEEMVKKIRDEEATASNQPDPPPDDIPSEDEEASESTQDDGGYAYNTPDDEDDEDTEEAEVKPVPPPVPEAEIRARRNAGVKTPYYITQEEFEDEFPEHSKIQISFYERDGVFTDDRDEVVSSPARIFGKNIVQQFDENPMDPDVVYVRYIPGGCDYEITKIYDSYQTAILGIPGDK